MGNCIVYTDYVFPACVTLLAAISCLLFLFRKFVCFFSSDISSFFFICGLLAISYPLLACLIRAAILHLSFCLHLFTSRFLSYVVLISDLLFQSAAFVFLDGGWVSEGLELRLVIVSLAFHLFFVGTVIFASVLLWL